MKFILAIAKRELDDYFQTIVGWLTLLGFVGITGLVFGLLITDATDPAYFGQEIDINEMLLPAFFNVLSVILLLLSPAISMRIFSEDYQQGSFPLLLSSPITSGQIVLGKFCGTLGYLAISFLATLHCVALLFWLGEPSTSILILNYLALFLCTASFLAIGLFVSSTTKNQLVSLSLSFTALLSLWFLGSLGDQYSEGLKLFFAQASPLPHLEALSKGLVNLQDLSYFILVTGFFLYLSRQKIESLRWQDGNRFARIGGVIIGAIFCSTLQYVAVKQNISWDFTSAQRYTLSSQSTSILQSLEKEIDIRAYFSIDSSDRLQFIELAKGIEAQTDKINIELIDPQKEPLRAEQDNIIVKYGTLIVESGEHQQRIEYSISEENLINTIVQVNSGTKHLICFSTGLDEISLEDPFANEAMGLIYQSLTAQNYAVKQVSWLEATIPSDCEVFVVGGPRKDIPKTQASRLKDYLLQGGQAFLLLDPIFHNDFSKELNNLGLKVGDDFILENNPKYQIQGGDPTFVILDEASIVPHPMFQMSNQTLLLQGLRSVQAIPIEETTDASESITSGELVYTSKNSWAESNYLEQLGTPEPNPETDVLGPVPILSMSTIQKEDSPPSHLIFLGGSTLVLNELVGISPANRDFFLNIIAWLVKEEAQINQRANEDQIATIQINQIQYLVMWLICLVIAPFSVLSGAFSTWRERRQA